MKAKLADALRRLADWLYRQPEAKKLDRLVFKLDLDTAEFEKKMDRIQDQWAAFVSIVRTDVALVEVMARQITKIMQASKATGKAQAGKKK